MTEERILKDKRLGKNITDEIVTRKRALNFYSLVNILPDPDMVLRKQGKDIRIYKELLYDSHVFACCQSRKAGVLSLEWDINRGSDKYKNAEFIRELLKKLDIHKLINDILNATQFGFQPLEIMWKKEKNGQVLPEKVVAKPPEWFCFDDNNHLKFRTKENYFGEELPNRKFLCPQSNPSYENLVDNCTIFNVLNKQTYMVEGNLGNIKITTPEDMYLLRALINYKEDLEAFGFAGKNQETL